MKKILISLIALAFVFPTFACAKTTGNDVTVLKINEVTHSVFYAPFYVAIENGYFLEEGIEIELTNGGGSDASMAALLSGGADIALLGPETGIYTSLGGPKDRPIIFAQLTKRDGSFLMGRYPEDDFMWTGLNNKEIIAGRKGGSPAMSLEYALNKNGLFNGENVTLNFDVQFNLTTAAFESGTGDYVTVFEPTASELQRAGKGHIVASVGKESGEVPFTTFMARESYLNKKTAIIDKFISALFKAFDFIDKNDAATIAASIKHSFPSSSDVSLTDSIESYKNIDAWQKDMTMTPEAFERLKDVMRNAKELDGDVLFEELVKNERVIKMHEKFAA